MTWSVNFSNLSLSSGYCLSFSRKKASFMNNRLAAPGKTLA